MPKIKSSTSKRGKAISGQGKIQVPLILGFAIAIILIVLGVLFIKNKGYLAETSSISTEDLSQAEVQKENSQPSFYIVKSGDNLWNVSESIYKSGYNWVDIAKANKLENPELIYAGTKLEIPKAQPKTPEQNVAEKTFEQSAESSIADDTYTVEKGDSLWSISVRAYGDGYRWVDIAKANNLTNPNLIHSGNIFKIPR